MERWTIRGVVTQNCGIRTNSGGPRISAEIAYRATPDISVESVSFMCAADANLFTRHTFEFFHADAQRALIALRNEDKVVTSVAFEVAEIFYYHPIHDGQPISPRGGAALWFLHDLLDKHGVRGPVIEPAWLVWNWDTVPTLAKLIRAERKFELLPILADALEEAGCTDTELLDHLRAGLPHTDNCWVLDLILGNPA